MSNKQILKLLKTKIEHYSKIRDKNDDEYCKIDEFALGIAGEKMSKYQKKKALDELQNSTIFVQGKIEAFQEIMKEIK